jgi:hypothetical protein
MARVVPLTEQKKYDQSAWGAQDQLVLTAVPAAASPALVGKTLVGAGALTVAGVYECLVPLTALKTALEIHLTATIAAGTASSAAHSLYYVTNAALPSSWVNKVAATGTGSLTSTTRQSSTISTLRGEQYARVAITLATSPSVTFTQAEYNGI